MNAEELKMVLTELREIHNAHIEQLGCRYVEQEQRRVEQVCLRHGGHEFVDTYLTGTTKQCKFCGAYKGGE
ncbi:hypothetical protein LCGC14_1727790 [marine sediment metagenome]|uniref:Transposase zinc-binding domain-containing protein n=1 Tax=marine sediment metagenome TaxID=412755 RepID=A0A0F9HAB5_9ZZZZ